MESYEIQYLTEVQVANMTGLALSTLRNKRSEGKGIPYSKLGRAVRYSLRDVVDFVEDRKIQTKD